MGFILLPILNEMRKAYFINLSWENLIVHEFLHTQAKIDTHAQNLQTCIREMSALAAAHRYSQGFRFLSEGSDLIFGPCWT